MILCFHHTYELCMNQSGCIIDCFIGQGQRVKRVCIYNEEKAVIVYSILSGVTKNRIQALVIQPIGHLS